MEIQQIGNGKIVIYIKGEELKQLPAPPQDITTAEAADILRLALGTTYDDSWESVYFELFPGRNSLLLFALQHSGRPSYFTFDSIETLISAAKACPSGLISYLSYINDTYILIVYPWNGDCPPQILFEFGDELNRPSHFALHLSEHSRVLAGPAALDELNAVFA
ncbi:MAG: adaptor protein MecA [Clostridiales bacterium]|jgi:hypothetical protein|nr:adaptor protein MecA [Clostridiales bacterium]